MTCYTLQILLVLRNIDYLEDSGFYDTEALLNEKKNIYISLSLFFLDKHCHVKFWHAYKGLFFWIETSTSMLVFVMTPQMTYEDSLQEM